MNRDETVIKLTGGVVVEVHENVQTLAELVQRAIVDGGVCRVNTSSGQAIVLNPAHIVYMEGQSSEQSANKPASAATNQEER